MKNHFIHSYAGNKRNETKNFLNNINLENIKNVIEPFCGTSAISFAIWKEHKDKFNYYLNDSDKKLIDIYNLMKNDSIENIENKVNEFSINIKNKEDWLDAFKNNDTTIYSYLFFKRFSNMGRYGFYPNKNKDKYKFIITKETKEFIEFIKQPYVHITHGDWFEIYSTFKNNQHSLFMIDPPYVMACNDFYSDRKLNVYQYFHDNKIENNKAHIYLILEDHWILRLLFMNNTILLKYSKQYEISKKTTNHLIIYNHCKKYLDISDNDCEWYLPDDPDLDPLT
jgi:site-specific DNA-adenine methylase